MTDHRLDRAQGEAICPVDCVPNTARPLALRAVMNNSFAFGGNNAVVVFAKV